MRLALALVVASGSLAYAGTAQWTTPPYDHGGLAINARAIELRGNGKIWFKLSFVNNTDQPMMVDPDQFQAKLPDGRQMARTKGVFDSRTHGAVAIGPHLSADINAEYVVGTPDKVTLELTGVILNGKPLALPPLVAQPSDRPWGAAPYEYGGLRVTVLSAEPSGKNNESLTLKCTFSNGTPAPMWVDKKLIQARLPDGSLVTPESSIFDGKQPKVVSPGQNTELKLEYKVGHPAQLSLVMGGVNIQGQPKLPELVVAPK